jgi:hypothetical protein
MTAGQVQQLLASVQGGAWWTVYLTTAIECGHAPW